MRRRNFVCFTLLIAVLVLVMRWSELGAGEHR